MLQHLLDRLVALGAAPLYGILAVVAAVENVFPPFPADTVVAFGGYLAARGERAIGVVFLAVWVGNVAGAMLMYALGRRYGADRLIARMGGGDPARARARLGALYGRYGIVALFISRFLPGVRGFVPPLAGAAHVPPVRAGFAIATASAVWYGAICYLAFRVGSDWDAVLAAVKRSGQWIGGVAVCLAIAGLAAWYVHRRRTA